VITGLVTARLDIERFELGQRFFFESQISLQVDVGGLRRFVAEPKGNDRTVYS